MSDNIKKIEKGEIQRKKQTNFIVTSEFTGKKKLSELVGNLVAIEANKIEKVQ